jgi:tRNA threonylcarbamoyladenosine biosynthesis protein TsaE
MATFISHSPAETEALGETWGRAAQPGLVIALSGDLGAGKTQLVKGLARGLNIPARVHSPTFSLVNIYAGGRLLLYHLDLYRLDTPEQIVGAGLDEYLSTRGVTVLEWAERWFAPPAGLAAGGAIVPKEAITGREYPDLFRWADIATSGTNDRRIVYEDPGD